VKRSLFSGKRLADEQTISDSPSTKRLKEAAFGIGNIALEVGIILISIMNQ